MLSMDATPHSCYCNYALPSDGIKPQYGLEGPEEPQLTFLSAGSIREVRGDDLSDTILK